MLAAIVTAYFAYHAVQQTGESLQLSIDALENQRASSDSTLKLAQEALALQNREFDIRNRPRIIPLDSLVIYPPPLSSSDSTNWLLTINIMNQSDLPAQWVLAYLKLFRNQTADSVLINKFSMMRYVGANETVKLEYSLPDSVLIKDGDTPTNRHIDFTVKYGRFASEESDGKYKTIWSFYIDPERFSIITRYTKFE